MSLIHVQPELAAVRTLLDSADLPSADLTHDHCRHFFYQGPPDAPTGLVGLELLGDVALLRSLVVVPQARASGMGSALVAHAEGFARSRGVSAVYLLTTTAEAFFLRRGYSRSPRAAAPPAIQSTREFADICPASSAFMSKQL